MTTAPVDIHGCLTEVNSTIRMFVNELNEIQNQSDTIGSTWSMDENKKSLITFITESIENLREDKRNLEKTIKGLKALKKKIRTKKGKAKSK